MKKSYQLVFVHEAYSSITPEDKKVLYMTIVLPTSESSVV